MPQSYTQLYYHIVWATKERTGQLTPDVLALVGAAIRAKARELDSTVLAANGVPDHLHLAVRLPATVCVAEFVEAVKGHASWQVNHSPQFENRLYWQDGYGALTFRKSELPTIARYIQRQQEHHRAGEVWAEFERFHD